MINLLWKILILNLVISTISGNTRSGRCPSAQYAFSGLPCSTEGEDDVCPWNYKCCPLTDGMKCFGPCPELAEPCQLQCPFGFEVNPSPCTICKCAEDPCSTASCPLGTKCVSEQYTPCAIEGRCGFKTRCIDDPSIYVDPTPKPNQCPDYWPTMGAGFQSCRGPDALCPGSQKCCASPAMSHFGDLNEGTGYCVDPCEDLSNCKLECSRGLAVRGACRICECASDPCDGIKCASNQSCQLLAAPCAYYPGRPPCPMFPICTDKLRPLG